MKAALNFWGYTLTILNFDYHVNQLCKKTSKNLHALARIAKYMDINKQRMLMKTFLSSLLSYCPLIWIFHSRKMEFRINTIHKSALKLVYEHSRNLTFHKLLPKDKSVNVHQINFSLLATEIFKSKTGMSPELMNVIFLFAERRYNLRSNCTLERKRDHYVYHGSESRSFPAPKLWHILPK